MTRSRHEWLGLVEVSGPFLAEPVLDDVFPQGLDALEQGKPQRLRAAYEEWRDAADVGDPDLEALHAAWIDEVLVTALELDPQVVRIGSAVPAAISATLPEHGVTFGPDIAVVEPGSDALLLAIHVFAPVVDLDATRVVDGWATTPKDRMVALLRAIGCPLGLVTNGEHWLLVHVPADGVTGFATWYARLWAQEPDTLRAFASLLGIRRFFGHSDAKLPKLYERSLTHQDKVTDALGDQVRQAVEVLVQALDRANQDRNGELLRDVEPRTLYEAGLTVMMRLVFLLAAEERGLLLLGEDRYDRFYALSTLRMQLRADTEEILERRRSAWSRLLALFRAVYGGIEHPILRLPALGGSLFDPDRYVFLEGRATDTSWRTDPAEPLPIDDRTVLLLLEAIQTFEGRTLSYRALDVEQIGHVYEGLLERTVVRVDDVTLELEASAGARTPRVGLGELESARLDCQAKVVALIKERSGRSEPAIRNGIGRAVPDGLAARLLTVCRGDVKLRDRILPYASLLRSDPWDYPLVRHPGSFVVAVGSDRRDSGTHYTPKSLTEKIVRETLTPLAYEGPSEGKPEAEWRLKTPEQLLDLKICDPAMGSGAFLVAVCRWLSDRLMEAWAIHESKGGQVDGEGNIVSDHTRDRLSTSVEERAIVARRLIAENCLYGVDQNPLAVELAKLSLWLTTIAKGTPFGFLDHNLRSGNSLLGITNLDQLIQLSLAPGQIDQLPLFGRAIRSAVERAIELRMNLRQIAIRDIKDVEAMAALDARSRAEIELPSRIADALCGILFAESNASRRKARIKELAALADEAAQAQRSIEMLISFSTADLAMDARDGIPRRPFHWPLEYPEVFERDRAGFDAFVGNPPFLGGQRIRGGMGSAFRNWLVTHVASGRRGSADLVAYFFIRAVALLRSGGDLGMLAVNTVAEGDTRQVGLEAITKEGAVIYSAFPNESWPGEAAVTTSRVHIRKGEWAGLRTLSGRQVSSISPYLTDRETLTPKKLVSNRDQSFQGTIPFGMGFILSAEEALAMIETDPQNSEVLFPFLNGDDLNTDPQQRPSRWIINFWDWPEEKARRFEEPWRRVEERVKPERQRRDEDGKFVLRKPLPERWWQFAEKRPGLYHAVGRGDRFDRHPVGHERRATPPNVMVCSEVTKHLAFTFVPNGYIMSTNLDVFLGAEDRFGICQSSIHEAWARQYSSRLETRLKYSIGNAFETFPFPERTSNRVTTIALDLIAHRKYIFDNEQIGLTNLYNRFHDPDDVSAPIERLREHHRELDAAVLANFGWEDIELDHDFREAPYLPENDRMRYAIAEPARIEILERLVNLNGMRALAEAVGSADTAQGNRRPSVDVATQQIALDLRLDRSGEMADRRSTAGQRIMTFLRTNHGWRGKAEILEGAGISASQWNDAISELLVTGAAERQGDRRATRYRFKEDT
ncbi:Eco57I restriction-modification methylase domain-containing protein [Methylobacterium indicum]|uniref:site-specific DNA-methyltransferase (adenine-specific) n=1 Tax=Methylobacterium indicum TaxID=1775910 RepID=A0A8H8WY31_9HYPH|nr:type IIL restriction-modification enzyme MmeI [Methylobacterium indicum]BCM86308.1 hypothetical protein mvi_47690 [Methylobacterium indicum]